MEKILQEIKEGKYLPEPVQRKNIPNISSYLPERPKKTSEERKKNWYKIGKVLWRGHKLQLHKESQVGARRTYEYYSQYKGDWTGPSCRQFSKMSRDKYGIELALRNKEFWKGNSSLNEGNLEESQVDENMNDTVIGQDLSTGLEIDEFLTLLPTAEPPMPTAEPPMPTAEPPMPTAEPPTPNR